MYDILQLNDMLVPELLDIAEQLKIPNAKKWTSRNWFTKYWIARLLPAQKVAADTDDKGQTQTNYKNHYRHYY